MIPLRDRLPTRRVPVVNYLLIATNVLVFVWQRMKVGEGYPLDRLIAEWGLVPRKVTRFPLEYGFTVFTSMFMHDLTGWVHIGGNMLYLWIFGDNVEDAMGRGRYAAFYLAAGAAAATAQILVAPNSNVPMVGASGAIAGVLAAYGSLYPRSPITVLNPIPLLWFIFGLFLEFPAWVVILLFFVANLMNGLGVLGRAYGGNVGGVAFFAHLGGFAAGLVLVRFFIARKPPRSYDHWQGWRSPGASTDAHEGNERRRRRQPWE